MSDIKAKLDDAVSNYIASNPGPGVQIRAITRNGDQLYAAAFGNRGLAEGYDSPIQDDTVFWLASATKLLAAICAVKCVDLGLVALDDDITPFVPDLASQLVRQDFGTENAKLVPREGPITLRQLLTLTAGLSYPCLEKLATLRATIPAGPDPILFSDRDDAIGPLNAQPGTKWEYSAGLDIAGFVVKAVSGLPLGEFLRKHIMEPCGVKDGDIAFELTPEMRTRLMGSHFRWPDGSGRITPRGNVFTSNVVEHLGGVGAYGTINAYSEVILPLINNGKHPKTGNQILKPETVREMFTPQLTPGQLEWLYKPFLANANGIEVIYPGIEKQWGLGFILTPEGMPSGRGKYTGAWAGFPNTYWFADHEKGLLFLAFTQMIPQEDERFMKLRYECEKLIYDHLKETA